MAHYSNFYLRPIIPFFMFQSNKKVLITEHIIWLFDSESMQSLESRYADGWEKKEVSRHPLALFLFATLDYVSPWIGN